MTSLKWPPFVLRTQPPVWRDDKPLQAYLPHKFECFCSHSFPRDVQIRYLLLKGEKSSHSNQQITQLQTPVLIAHEYTYMKTHFHLRSNTEAVKLIDGSHVLKG